MACSASSSGVSVAFFDTGLATPTRITGSVTVNCTRSDLVNDPATFYVALGVTSPNTTNQDMGRARLVGGASQDTLDYWLYRDSAETLVWTDKSGSNGGRITATLSFGSGATASQTLSFTFTVPPASQQTRPVLKGTYQAAQTLRLYQSATQADETTSNQPVAATSTFPVQVTVPENCVLSSPPGNLAFTYTSFQTSASTASTSFAVTCMSNVAYTLSLDATSGTLAGLAYTLGLSATSRVGTGVAQSATLTGTIAAGQAGVCSSTSCTASAVRTLTVTY
ncbi:MAG: spore coat protein U domain-containing protein [Rubrivivax sp.]